MSADVIILPVIRRDDAAREELPVVDEPKHSYADQAIVVEELIPLLREMEFGRRLRPQDVELFYEVLGEAAETLRRLASGAREGGK